ncbi:formate acetyltransferase [Mannheimia haemolytica]|nr:formate acetyltransferase [Mannheimia haemolytica]
MTQLTDAQQKAWEGFAAGEWQTEVNVRDFIQKTTHLMRVMSLS